MFFMEGTHLFSRREATKGGGKGRVFGRVGRVCFFSTKHVFDVNSFAATQFGTVVFSLKSLTKRESTKILRRRIPMYSDIPFV